MDFYRNEDQLLIKLLKSFCDSFELFGIGLAGESYVGLEIVLPLRLYYPDLSKPRVVESSFADEHGIRRSHRDIL